MSCTIKQYINPIALIESIKGTYSLMKGIFYCLHFYKGYDGAAINVRLQEDVNEFFNRITDKIE